MLYKMFNSVTIFSLIMLIFCIAFFACTAQHKANKTMTNTIMTDDNSENTVNNVKPSADDKIASEMSYTGDGGLKKEASETQQQEKGTAAGMETSLGKAKQESTTSQEKTKQGIENKENVSRKDLKTRSYRQEQKCYSFNSTKYER